jgi:PIN domain nuclease of toxin-antitoxin system
MNRFVADTMALVLYLEKRKMPALVKQSFEDAERHISEIVIPAMCLAEVAYLHERGRIQIKLSDVDNLLSAFSGFSVHPVDLPVVDHAFAISDIPELHDRLIAGTARKLSLPLLTNDPVIGASSFVVSLWS